MRTIFLHIPKNAGSTLHLVMEANFRPWEIFSFRFPRERSFRKLISMSPSRLSRLQTIKGHWPYGLHQLGPAEARYVTLLRDPVKRFVSEYNYILRNPKLPLYSVIKDAGLDVVGAVEAGLLQDNEQTRWCLPGGLQRPGPLDAAAGEEAWETLAEHGSFIGLVDRFDESLLLMADICGWAKAWYYERNVARSRSEMLDHGQRDRLEALCQADRRFLELAERHFDSRWAEFSGRNPGALPEFKRRNEKRRLVTKTEYTARYFLYRTLWKITGTW
jgi:hypothetical protein